MGLQVEATVKRMSLGPVIELCVAAFYADYSLFADWIWSPVRVQQEREFVFRLAPSPFNSCLEQLLKMLN